MAKSQATRTCSCQMPVCYVLDSTLTQISCWIALSSCSPVARHGSLMDSSAPFLCLISLTRHLFVTNMPRKWWETTQLILITLKGMCLHSTALVVRKFVCGRTISCEGMATDAVSSSSSCGAHVRRPNHLHWRRNTKRKEDVVRADRRSPFLLLCHRATC